MLAANSTRVLWWLVSGLAIFFAIAFDQLVGFVTFLSTVGLLNAGELEEIH